MDNTVEYFSLYRPEKPRLKSRRRQLCGLRNSIQPIEPIQSIQPIEPTSRLGRQGKHLTSPNVCKRKKAGKPALNRCTDNSLCARSIATTSFSDNYLDTKFGAGIPEVHFPVKHLIECLLSGFIHHFKLEGGL